MTTDENAELCSGRGGAMARSIVIWGGPPYLGPANSTHSEMARAFRELGHDVLYLELEGDAGAFRDARRRRPGPVRGTARAEDGTVIARIPKVPMAPYALFGPSHRANMRLAAGQLGRLAPVWMREGEGDTVVIHRGWFSSRLAWKLPGARHVYDCVDDHLVSEEVVGRPALVRRVRREEGRLLEAAELTVCVSDVLAETRREIARRCIVLPNASRPADFEGEFPEPEPLAGLPRPRALFLGRVGPKVDTDLIAAAARAASSVAWVLAGEVRGADLGPLPTNVLALGTVPHRDMPALAAHCDVGVAPLRLTKWNRASSQLKFGDYMAAGLPVVSTPLPVPESLAREVPGAVFLARTPEEFARATAEAASVGREPRERCRAWAREHTWRRRAEDLLGELDREGNRR